MEVNGSPWRSLRELSREAGEELLGEAPGEATEKVLKSRLQRVKSYFRKANRSSLGSQQLL
jgi:hypothetical protein